MKSGSPIWGWQRRARPVVIVSRYDPDAPRAIVLVVPLTSRARQSKYEAPIPRLPFLRQDCVANIQGLIAIPYIRLERKLGDVPKPDMGDLKRALQFALDLE